jgi:protocadherin-15
VFFACQCTECNVVQVSSGVLSGVLATQPEKIHAVDMDSLNRPIQYSFLSGTPSSYKDYFEIDPKSGAVRQIRPVDISVARKFEIVVKASTVILHINFRNSFLTFKILYIRLCNMAYK